MSSVFYKSVLDLEFRSNRCYDLVPFDRLSTAYREAYADLQKDPDFFGILLPKNHTSLGVKSACRNVASLFYSLQEAGPLPHDVKSALKKTGEGSVRELVLDGILEMKWNGAFLSGADAHPFICESTLSVSAKDPLAELSIAALTYAQNLEINEAVSLSARLYFYNRMPVTPEWKAMFSSTDSILRHVTPSGGVNQDVLEKHWAKVSKRPSHDGWMVWQSRQKRASLSESTGTYKLYLSPHCEFLQEAFSAMVDVLTEVKVPIFKIGSDVYGMLRPDKMVAYFTNYEELQETAHKIGQKLQGCPAHGVPFTSNLAGDGLLSWGVDPPKEHQQVLGWQERQSWRLWLTNRLATYLLLAKTAHSGHLEPWQFALDRLRMDGVDTENWRPLQTIWEKGWSREEE